MSQMTLEKLAAIMANSFNHIEARFDAIDEKFDLIDKKFEGVDDCFRHGHLSLSLNIAFHLEFFHSSYSVLDCCSTHSILVSSFVNL